MTWLTDCWRFEELTRFTYWLAEVAAPPVELAPPDPGEVALCLLSGGTTGRPKLIPRTHRDYLYQARATAQVMGLTRDGAYLAALPLAHNAALGCPGALGALDAGAKVVVAGSPAPDEAFGLITSEGVTLTTLMPAFLPLSRIMRLLLGASSLFWPGFAASVFAAR